MVRHGDVYDTFNEELPGVYPPGCQEEVGCIEAKNDHEYALQASLSFEETLYEFTDGLVLANTTVDPALYRYTNVYLFPEEVAQLMEEFSVPQWYAEMIWYYSYNPEMLTQEVRALKESSGFHEPGRCGGQNCDVLLVMTSAASDYRGYFLDQSIVILHSTTPWYWHYIPSWRVEPLNLISDVFVHEVGHFMGQNHSCSEFTLEDIDLCLDKEDIMSWYRDRYHGTGFNEFSSEHVWEYALHHQDGSAWNREWLPGCNRHVE